MLFDEVSHWMGKNIDHIKNLLKTNGTYIAPYFLSEENLLLIAVTYDLMITIKNGKSLLYLDDLGKGFRTR